MMDGIEQKAVELLEKFEKLAADIAPQAMEVGLAAARVAAAHEIATGLLLIALGLGAWLLTALVWRRAGKITHDYDREMARGLSGALGTTITVCLLVGGLVLALNVWAWVGIFYPELWIAKQVLGW